MILGVDEVGRGPWAGPLVVGAVVLGGVNIQGLTDSKKLTPKQRESLDKRIRAKALAIGLGWVDAEEIDQIGLSAALVKATKQAVGQINAPYDEIIIDGKVNFLKGTDKEKLVTNLTKADLLVPCVSAASIIAKVARDKFMYKQDKVYPGYRFKFNVGYGTHGHIDAIDKFGITKLHRMSYLSLKQRTNTVETTKLIGENAEEIASLHLQSLGHKILDRNWKTKFCEIDIVSKVGDVVHFVEVKYRKNSNQGGGLAAITPKKLKQMKFAAEYYALRHEIDDLNLRLSAVSLVGTPPEVEDFLEVE